MTLITLAKGSYPLEMESKKQTILGLAISSTGREVITKAALDYKLDDPSLPFIQYSQSEKEVWKFCYSNLKKLFKTNACNEFRWTIEQFEKHVGFTEDNIPQLDPISKFL